jgi:1-deoxy-D-xylulose-5-phosphate reductoisomerase
MREQTNVIKGIAILGSTGSIGRQTLEVVRALPDKFRIIGLAAGDNLELLSQQISEFNPRFIYFNNKRGNLTPGGVKFISLEEMAERDEVDIVVAATSGKAGLNAVMAAIRANKQIALSNKESLVMAGEIILSEMKRSHGWILPVDSEHSAIWQCLNGETKKPARIILTASGGPFLRCQSLQLKEVTPEQALNHPSWQMGKKVTVDSATLMNKGLEVIEAHWLFDMPYDRIDVLIHPQSIIHSMVEMVDGSIKAQLSCPDMRLPIQFALSYPERLANSTIPKLNWSQVNSLNFETPDYDRFPCLRLAIEAGKRGGTYPAVLCGSDETAVDLFLKKLIGFADIPRIIEEVLNLHKNIISPQLEEVLAADTWAREQTLKLAGGVG